MAKKHNAEPDNIDLCCLGIGFHQLQFARNGMEEALVC